MAVRKYLDEAQVRRVSRSVKHHIRNNAEKWGVHGWAWVGSASRQRLALRVPRRLVQPKFRITPIPLPHGLGLLKPRVSASCAFPHNAVSIHDRRLTLRDTEHAFLPEQPDGQPVLAPGARISVDG